MEAGQSYIDLVSPTAAERGEPWVTLWDAKTRFRGSDLRLLPLGYAAFWYSLIRPSTTRRRLSRT